MRLKSGTITSAANTQTVKGLTADAVDFLLWVFGRAYGLLRSRRCSRRSLREDERSMVAIVPPGYAWKVIDGDAGRGSVRGQRVSSSRGCRRTTGE